MKETFDRPVCPKCGKPMRLTGAGRIELEFSCAVCKTRKLVKKREEK